MTLLEDIKLKEPQRIRKELEKNKETERKKMFEKEQIIQEHKKIVNELFENKYKIEKMQLELDGCSDYDIKSISTFKIDELDFKLILKIYRDRNIYYILELWKNSRYDSIISHSTDNTQNKLEEILESISSAYHGNFPDETKDVINKIDGMRQGQSDGGSMLIIIILIVIISAIIMYSIKML